MGRHPEGPGIGEEAEALERFDFEIMEAIRRRVDEIVQDPETAEKLKPYWGKHCKRVCFHDDYLPAFNRPNVHLVDTDGRGVDELTARGPVVNGVEYPVDLLIYASGFEVTTDLHQRLGFDPKGRDGVTLSERWAEGAHTLHGVLASGFPNLLLISLVQGGFGTNFSHLLSESAKHVAHIVEACVEQGIAVIEPEEAAEEEWLSVLHSRRCRRRPLLPELHAQLLQQRAAGDRRPGGSESHLLRKSSGLHRIPGALASGCPTSLARRFGAVEAVDTN